MAPIPFEIGIFTNLAHEHLDFHNTEESYFNSKLKLFAQCKIGIFNCDDKYSRKASNEVECESISTGILWPADAMAREIVQKGISGSEYIYKEKSLIFKAKILLPGAYNIYNSLLAIKTAIRLGIKPCCVKEALLSLTAIDGRFEATVDKIIVIRDYAHTPEALENLLKTVKSLKKSKQNVITVFGCGGERDKTKRPVMAEIAEKNSDFVIVTNDNPRGENENEIISDILKGFKDTAKRTVISDRKRAIEYAIMNTVQNDIVVIAGKGGESYIIDKAGYHHFSEKEIIEKALSRRNEEEAKYANKARNSDNN